ncbi:MAG: hypothetical protein LWX83_15340, partial [Anaerolineae bacterium]|nr:hypothetical protein [Anaerolineae bacterium]
MVKKPQLFVVLIMFLLIFSLACELSVIQTPTEAVDIKDISTAAAQTVESRFTQTALQNQQPSATGAFTSTATGMSFTNSPSAMPSSSSSPTFSTPSLTPASPTPTKTPTQPTATRTPPTFVLTYVTATPSPSPVPCNWVRFVSDVSVPDGSAFNPGQVFIKTWRLQNIGTCTWTSDYELVLA